MTTEDVTFRIKAEDEATEKIRKVTADVKQQVEAVKEVGGKAKASTELVGTLASSLGGTGLGAFAGELAQMTERVTAFSEAAKGAPKGAMLMKAGIVAAVGVMAVKFGQAIGGMIFKARDLAAEIELSTKQAQRSFDEWESRFSKQQDFELEVAIKTGDTSKIETLKTQLQEGLDAETKRIERLQQVIEDGEAYWTGPDDQAVAEAKSQLAIAEQRQKLLQANKEKIEDQTGALKQQMDVIDAGLASTKYVDQLKKQTEEIGLSARELDKRKAIEATIEGPDRQAALELIKIKHDELQAIKDNAEAEKKATAKADADQAKKEANAKRIVDLRKKTADALQLEIIKLSEGEKAARSYQLQLQGLDAATAEQFTDIQETIKKATQQKESAKGKTPDLTTKDQRLLSGRGIAAKSKQEELAEKQVKLADSQLRLAGDMLAQLEKIAEKEPLEIGTVGD